MTVQKHGTPSGQASHNALMSDMHKLDTDGDASGAGSTEMECIDENDGTEDSTMFCCVAFSASATPGRDLSKSWVPVDSRPCFINLTAFRSDFVSLDPPSGTSRVGGMGVDVCGSCNVEIAIPLVSGQIIRRTFHALYTPYMSARCALRIGHLSVSLMQSHNGCESL
jgi:hypothetical protein